MRRLLRRAPILTMTRGISECLSSYSRLPIGCKALKAMDGVVDNRPEQSYFKCPGLGTGPKRVRRRTVEVPALRVPALPAIRWVGVVRPDSAGATRNPLEGGLP